MKFIDFPKRKCGTICYWWKRDVNEFNDSKGASTWLVALHSAYNGILDLMNKDPEVPLTHDS